MPRYGHYLDAAMREKTSEHLLKRLQRAEIDSVTTDQIHQVIQIVSRIRKKRKPNYIVHFNMRISGDFGKEDARETICF